MSDQPEDDPYIWFAKLLTVYFGLAVLSVPVGLGIAQIIKYFMGL